MYHRATWSANEDLITSESVVEPTEILEATATVDLPYALDNQAKQFP
jgi:hypothetical protein